VKQLRHPSGIVLSVLIMFVLLVVAVSPGFSQTRIVTSLADSGAGTLRQAVSDAQNGDTIGFAVTGTITLSSQISIDKDITILGPGEDKLTVSGNNSCRVFKVDALFTYPTVMISDLTIANGNAGGRDTYGNGGGICNYSDNLALENVTFESNTANNTQGDGGAVYNFQASPTMINCTFFNNITNNGNGGAICNNYSSPNVINCVFAVNKAQNRYYESYGHGGGICNSHSSPNLSNCTFYGNIASLSNGGGICNIFDSSSTVTNCTFSGNRAYSGGAGMYNSSSSSAVINCIFWGDSGEEIHGGESGFSYCVVEGGLPGGSHIIDSDPKLQVIADNGGPTQTIALDPDSSAIDAGIAVDGMTADQRGFPRPSVEGGSFDIGSYEFSYPSNKIVTGYTITATASAGGTITPESADVTSGQDQHFTISPDDGYFIDSIFVDGEAISPDADNAMIYSFENVSADHEISADFYPVSSGGGCSVSALPDIALLLALPLLVFSVKIK